jgi:beta-galactosidase/beta-glucuronidase
MPREILVPFPFESSLSGIRELPAKYHMWYRRNISIPSESLNGRVVLKFEAVDWQTTVYVNRKQAGNHTGGYDGFEMDITELLVNGEAELVVGVYDPTEKGNQPHGKQSRGVFKAQSPTSKYTSTSGIWATVWLEFVPRMYIADIYVQTAVAESSASVTVSATLAGDAPAAGCTVALAMFDEKASILETYVEIGSQGKFDPWFH